MNGKICVSLIVAAALTAQSSYGAFQITDVATPHVITFETNVGYDGPSDNNSANDVIKIGVEGKYRMMESGSSNWKANSTEIWAVGLSAEAWAWRHPNADFGLGLGVRTNFGDYNNDGDLVDATGVYELLWVGPYFGAEGNRGLVIGNAETKSGFSTNFDLTLRIQNMSNVTATLWNFGFDLWGGDSDSNNSNLIVSYSTDNVDYTVLDTFAGTNTAGAFVSVGSQEYSNVAGTVAHGDYIYLRFHHDRQSNNGSAWGIDNISVAVVPEPSTYAMISGLALLAFAVIHRRRSK